MCLISYFEYLSVPFGKKPSNKQPKIEATLITVAKDFVFSKQISDQIYIVNQPKQNDFGATQIRFDN